MNNHQPLRSVSCRRRTLTASDGMSSRSATIAEITPPLVLLPLWMIASRTLAIVRTMR